MQIDRLDFDSTPRKLGYIMPAEWEEHDATWLAWPYESTTFPDRVEEVEEAYVKIIGTIHRSENINLFVKDVGMKKRAKNLLGKDDIDIGKINFLVVDYADVWIRDYGPTFVVNKNKNELAMVYWIFNAWGEKYEGLMKDAKIPSIISQKMQLNCFYPGIVLEGGSIDVNGKGTLLTTEQTLLNKNRNSHLNKQEIENYLKEYLGVDHIIWLKNGIAGDDTDGHIDDIARFVNPRTVLCAYEDDKTDQNYPSLKENYELLLGTKDQDGNSLEVVKLPMPGFVGDKHGRLPASYANFYIGNRVVLVPTFGHENDQLALSTIQKCFLNRKVVGINCNDLIHGFGTIHCITQQQPSMNRFSRT